MSNNKYWWKLGIFMFASLEIKLTVPLRKCYSKKFVKERKKTYRRSSEVSFLRAVLLWSKIIKEWWILNIIWIYNFLFRNILEAWLACWAIFRYFVTKPRSSTDFCVHSLYRKCTVRNFLGSIHFCRFTSRNWKIKIKY